MKKRLIQLTGILFLLFIGFLSLDLSSKKGESLETVLIFGTESLAFGCGQVSYNHHREVDTITFCYGGGTLIQAVTGHDCRVSDQDCCRFPNTGSCLGIGG
jgi:hypothetical protein